MPRGRGGSRGGRGRGGGRGGRRGRGRSSRGRGGYSGASPASRPDTAEEQPDHTLDINHSVEQFFLGTASFDQHYDAQQSNKLRYTAGLLVLEKNGVEISQNARVRSLAAAWARGDHVLADMLLSEQDNFGLVKVLKALSLLDSARQIRTEERKLKRLQDSGSKKLKAKMGKLKSNIDNLKAVKPKVGSATGSICKHVARWVRKFSEKDLEFFALHYPTEPCRKLADICHFNPKKDFPNLPWFLPFCFGSPAPKGTMVHRCKEVTADNVNDLIKEFSVPFSHIKQHKDKLTNDTKARIASYTETLNYLIWNYEDLQCEEVDQIMLQRLEDGEKVTLRTGKLMERMLTLKVIREEIVASSHYYRARGAPTSRCKNPTKVPFMKNLIPMAEERMKRINLSLEPPIVVIGDRSGSMEVAIKTSTIIASLLTAITSAKLVFFNTTNMDAEFIPTNIEEVLEMAVTITAEGGTAPAASLYPFYERKEVVKTFIVVTDEEENANYMTHRFAPLFKKYHDEVYPANLVFVSFLRNQHQAGHMVDALKKVNITPMQFKFDGTRPDLCKLDTLFGILSSRTENFDVQLREMEGEIETDGLIKVFEKMTTGSTEPDVDPDTFVFV